MATENITLTVLGLTLLLLFTALINFFYVFRTKQKSGFKQISGKPHEGLSNPKTPEAALLHSEVKSPGNNSLEKEKFHNLRRPSEKPAGEERYIILKSRMTDEPTLYFVPRELTRVIDKIIETDNQS